MSTTLPHTNPTAIPIPTVNAVVDLNHEKNLLKQAAISLAESVGDKLTGNEVALKLIRGKPTDDELAKRFRFHTPIGEAEVEAYARVRGAVLNCALLCTSITPASPEQTRAINKLQEGMLLFTAALDTQAVPPSATTVSTSITAETKKEV